ncbi:hypothetical protein VP01_24g6 [Puccinia sorghi]|uniref:Integrase catalytic domain-containing protein n=1 Tax=Puccinia sorghi TaxID=27349 RepID=A0A0L6V7I7_9BASI|nr:hypothetical protein VP01_24g6 [Puccinia sorghi]
MAEVVPRASGNNVFRKAMLKTALETIPQLTEENYSIWKDKMTALLKLQGVLKALNEVGTTLEESVDAELVMLLLSKMDSVTHNNVCFASSQSSNCAHMFNNFLYVKFQEDLVETFVTDIKVSIKKLVNVGIDLPQDILAYLVLFKFPNSLQNLKRQIMHSDKELDVEFVCNHLVQFNNESKAESTRQNTTTTDAALFLSKGNPQKVRRTIDLQINLVGQKDVRVVNTIRNKMQITRPIIAGIYIPTKPRIGGKTRKLNGKLIAVPRPISSMTRNTFENLKWDNSTPSKPVNKERYFLFVPDIVINLVSAGKLVRKGCHLHSQNSKFTVSKDGKTVLVGRITGNLFSVDKPDKHNNVTQSSAHLAAKKDSLMEIHKNFGHASLQRINPLLENSISKAKKDNFECQACVLSKITKQSFKELSEFVSKPFKRIHLDLIGPINPESSLKHHFILTVVDNHSGYLAGFPLVNKDDTTDVLINLLKSEHHKQGYYPKKIFSDGGGEFVGNRLANFLNENQIHRLISEPYHLEHNGIAKQILSTQVKMKTKSKNN